MTVIRPNSVSGITSITAQANEINFFRSNGTLAGLQLNGVNFNTTTGISTLAALKITGNLDVEGVLTYQDVTNVDSLGIGTFRTGINVSGGQLDVGSNIKLGNAGVITATTFSGSGANLTNLNASNIASGTVPTARLGSGTANSSTFLRGDSTFQTVNTDLLSDTSPQLGGNLASNGNNINIADSTDGSTNRITFGSAGDLQLFHDGNHSYIDNNTGNLIIKADGQGLKLLSEGNIILRDNDDSTNMIRCINAGQIELYHNGAKKFDTITTGVRVHGDEGGTAQLQLLADQGDDNPDYWRFIAETNGVLNIQDYGSGNWYNNIRCTGNTGGVELYHNNVKAVSTSSTGINVWGNSGNGILDIYPTGSAVYSILNLHNTAGGSAFNAQLIATSGQSVYLGSGGTGSVNLRTGNSDLKVVCNHQGEVRLYHNVTQKFTTKSWGAQVEGTGALQVPDGTTAQRPTAATGMIRANTTTNFLEMYGTNSWVNIASLNELGTSSNPAKSGKVLYNLGKPSGNYYIKPDGYSGSAIECYVDMTTHGGGWVLVASYTIHSGFEQSSNTGGLNQSSVKSYATSQPPNGNTRLLPKDFINYLAHQNTTNGSDSDYSIMGVHGRSGTGYVHWEVKANSSNRNSSFDFFTVMYRTRDANNNMDVKIRNETSTNSTTDYVGKSISGSYSNYNAGRGGTIDGNGSYHYLIDDYYGGYEWAFRENSDDIPNQNGFNLSVMFIR